MKAIFRECIIHIITLIIIVIFLLWRLYLSSLIEYRDFADVASLFELDVKTKVYSGERYLIKFSEGENTQIMIDKYNDYMKKNSDMAFETGFYEDLGGELTYEYIEDNPEEMIYTVRRYYNMLELRGEEPIELYDFF